MVNAEQGTPDAVRRCKPEQTTIGRCKSLFGVETSVAMLGEGWPPTLRGTIAIETGIDLVMVPLKERGEPVSAITPRGFGLAVDTSIPPHFTGN